ncbi:MAG: restriction endonuclease subunit S [Lentimicrobium sp.]|jgi:type I restriction enzyme S subunit
MKQGWELKRLDDACEVEYGTRVVQKRDGGKIYPVYGGGGATFFMDTFNREDCLVVARFAMSAQCTRFVEGKFFLNDSGLTVKPKNDKELLPDFLNLQMLFLNDHIYSLSRGTAQRNLDVPAFRNIQISYPKSIQEQNHIVSILDEAFAAIARAKANAEQNLKNAKELFESYLQGVFEKLFEERETKRISEVAKVIGGYSFKSGDFTKEGKYQVIRMGNVRPGIIRENESPVFIEELDAKALSKALLIPKDVIITQTGTKNKRDYGFTVIIEKENYLLNQRIAAIRFKKEYLPEFFLYFSWTNIFKDQYFANETGTVGQGNVGIGAITDSQVPFIPLKEQQTIVSQLDALRAETKRLEAIYQQKLLNLEELKKSVLQRAFAGELT